MEHHFSHQGRATKAAHTGGWQHKLKRLIDEHNHMKANGASVASNRTREERHKKLFQMFEILRNKLNFKIEDPDNLKVKHIEGLVKYWVEEGYAAASIDNNLSHLRLLCLWLKKPGMVKSLLEYAPHVKCTYAAKHDKGFTGNDVDFWEIWQKVQAMDQYVAMQLLLIKAFGARRKEAVMFKPLIADREMYIELFEGTKGGRPRQVPVDDGFQRNVLMTLKNFVAGKLGSANGHIGDPDKDLEQNLKRYSYVLGAVGLTKKALGVTGHGLRSDYANDQLAKLGVISTIRGGSGKAEDKLTTQTAYLKVSEALGHSREDVMTAYAGQRRKPVDGDALRPNGTVEPYTEGHQK